MQRDKIKIDTLIKIVANGGCVKTGFDIFNKNDVLILGKDIPVNNVNVLIAIKETGVMEIPISPANGGGLWDSSGNHVVLKPVKGDTPRSTSGAKNIGLEAMIRQINEQKQEASVHFKKAKTALKSILNDIRNSGGVFDAEVVENAGLSIPLNT